ncbi:MAG: hypothetical protein ACHQF4_11330 [Sphingobacteriales bacterium]
MGKPNFNPRLSFSRQKVNQLNFKKLLILAQATHDAILTNAVQYVTPVPTLVSYAAAITALKNAIAALGPKSNKGTMAQLLDCKNKAAILKGLVVQMITYVNNTAQIASSIPATQAAILGLSGFPLRSARSRIPAMNAITGLHLVNSKKYPPNTFTLRWKKSTGLFTGAKPNVYNIYITAIGVTTFITTVTKALYQVPSGGGTLQIVTIKPVNAAGEGVGTSIAVPAH